MDLVAEELGLSARPHSGFVTRMASRCWPRKGVTFFFRFDFFFGLFQALWMFKVRISLSLYHRLPFNMLSRAWGTVHSVDLPVWLRAPTIRLYVWFYKCDLGEAECEDPREYRNLSEFFRRKLKPELRPIDPFASLVSSEGDCRGQGFRRPKNVEKFEIVGLLFAFSFALSLVLLRCRFFY